MTSHTKSPVKPSPDESHAAVSVNPEPPTFADAPPPPPAVVTVPSYSRWFSWDNIHQCELRHLPEFFDGRSPSKNPKVYKYYRNSIIRSFRDNPSTKLTFTQVRKTTIGDVGSIRRVYDFLESWGLINYTSNSSKPPILLKWEDKDSKSANPDGPSAASADTTAVPPASFPKKRLLCSACKSLLSIACFASEKNDIALCSRCYVRGNYRVGLSSSDFKRVEMNNEVKTEWTDKETLLLLEAVLHHGDDWKKVAARVSGRNEKECIKRFVKLPFGEQFVGPPESTEVDSKTESELSSLPNKKMRLTPLADASNPIMAQAAFLSALVGVEVAQVASQAAVMALSDLTDEELKGSIRATQESDITHSGGGSANEAFVEAQKQLDKEQDDLERAVSAIAVQMKEMHEKVVHFEEVDLQVEREWQQFKQLENSLFNDQHTLLVSKSSDSLKTLKNTEDDMTDRLHDLVPVPVISKFVTEV